MFPRHGETSEGEPGVSSGIGPVENNECRIDPAAFETFVNALPEHHRRTSHALARALFEGSTAIVLVLAERAATTVVRARTGTELEGHREDVRTPALTGVPTPAEGGAPIGGLRERARESIRPMPRRPQRHRTMKRSSPPVRPP